MSETDGFSDYESPARWLKGLRWDGAPRVQTWLSTYLGVTDSTYSRTVGEYFLISAAARMVKPGLAVESCLMLEGDRRSISAALATIAGDHYYVRNDLDPMGDHARYPNPYAWIIELCCAPGFANLQLSVLKESLANCDDGFSTCTTAT
jgi:predicted P-loop ATPase